MKYIDRTQSVYHLNGKHYVIERPCIVDKRICQKNKHQYIGLKKKELITLLSKLTSNSVRNLKNNYIIWLSQIKDVEETYNNKLAAQRREQQAMDSKRHISHSMYIYNEKDNIRAQLLLYKTLSYIQTALKDNLFALHDLQDIEAIRIPHKAFVALQ